MLPLAAWIAPRSYAKITVVLGVKNVSGVLLLTAVARQNFQLVE